MFCAAVFFIASVLTCIHSCSEIMRIKELKISNFRNFNEEVTIVPKVVNGMDMVVLVGGNNVGKTSILTILHYLFNP
ncbi:AAA family ATPase [Paenibacillus sp. FSL R7-269]|uniref:AAA family ATPase n=1 Tax=Paenibacillus sp. FSL R7-269 TaxID=1226755 RepID=UPI0009FBF98E